MQIFWSDVIARASLSGATLTTRFLGGGLTLGLSFSTGWPISVEQGAQRSPFPRWFDAVYYA